MAGRLLLLLLCAALAGELRAEAGVFIKKENADKFLERTKRANSFFEEVKKGSIERECNEERCSKEEAREAFEDQEKTEEFWNVYVDGNQCSSNPCHYGGHCKDGIGSYTCSCLDGYQGKNCEFVIPKYCKINNGDCEQFCSIKKSAQKDVLCSCAKGYVLAEDGKRCVSSVKYPCGKVFVKRKKRSVILPDDNSDVTSDQDGPLTSGTSLEEDIVTTTESPTPRPGNETSSKTPYVITRIVGGDECHLGECPWQAVLLNEAGEEFCGGTILNENFILTAAHCMNQSKELKVVVGEVDREKKEQSETMHTVDKILVHSKYIAETYDNDIALIKLKEPIVFSEYVIAACLPEADFANEVLMNQRSGMVSGFGREFEGGRLSKKLKVLEVPYVDRSTCKQSTNFAITENMFCAGYETEQKDACQGDSGGPHVTRYKDTYFVTGIVSWGEGCAKKGKYGVYTKLSRFLRWAVLVNKYNEWFCGGTILNEYFILSAAHCIKQYKDIQVLVGMVDKEKEEPSRAMHRVEKIIPHAEFDNKTYDSDIALLKLEEPITFSEDVIPACLPEKDFANNILMSQTFGIVSGFGRTFERAQLVKRMKVLQIPYVNRRTCKLALYSPVTENMFCAGYDKDGRDACQGDGGGPHVTQYNGTYFVTGVISWGEGCGRQGKYGVYTKLSKFLPWTEQTGGRRCSSSPCQHNGMCEDNIRGYICTCAEGYEGENCAFAKNECRHQAKEGCHHFCYPGSNSYRCSCADGYELGKDKKQCIALGPNGTSGTGMIMQVSKKHIHIRYDEDTGENNIALLQLQEHAECNNQQLPVCIPERDFAEHILIPKLAGTVSGWRMEGDELQGDELQVSYLPAEDCKQALNISLTNRQFCGHLQEAVDKRLAGGSFLATEYKGTWFLTGILGSWPLEDTDWETFLFTNTARYMIWFKQKMK
ncbi:coagulation factor X [Grus japonensis]|uniref:Vitamin K-dependent protein C n=1 Tax=Grus japonensis TaxID=30415 RepID=A0ABC9W1R2_GRUJA